MALIHFYIVALLHLFHYQSQWALRRQLMSTVQPYLLNLDIQVVPRVYLYLGKLLSLVLQAFLLCQVPQASHLSPLGLLVLLFARILFQMNLFHQRDPLPPRQMNPVCQVHPISPEKPLGRMVHLRHLRPFNHVDRSIHLNLLCQKRHPLL